MLNDKNPQTKHRFICLHGQGGSGKSVMMNKVSTLVRSKGLLGLDCAQTNLASLNFEGGVTAHTLTGYPVIEDGDDNDNGEKVDCRPSPERLEVLLNAVLINWDEFFSAHCDQWEASVRLLNENPNLIWCLYGDSRQIPPIVTGGTAVDTILASVKSSPLWSQVKVLFLRKNMRLEEMIARDNSTPEEEEEIEDQQIYALQLGSVGEDIPCMHVVMVQEEISEYETKKLLALDKLQFFINTETEIEEAINWLYPTGIPTAEEYDSGLQPSRVILATDNEKVDFWNSKIQSMNPNPTSSLISRDYFSDVDDTKGYLAAILTTSVKRDFSNTQVPDHEIQLKVGDICLITRNMNCLGLASNSKVRILRINKFSIVVCTMDSDKRTVIVPRIRFVFKLKYGSSFNLTRIQFPLRLAYAMTINRSQGQSIDFLLLDITKQAFEHGQAYVALSRIRRSKRIRLILLEEDFYPNSFSGENTPTPFIRTIIYPKLILYPPNNE
jgi:hypothetical protein